MVAQLKEIASDESRQQKASLLSTTNVIAAVILIASIVWLTAWFYSRSGKIYVSDARIAATLISVSSRMSGWVESFPVNEGQFVKKGDLLAAIDARGANLRLQELDSHLATIEAEYSKQEAELHLTEKQINSRLTVQHSKFKAAESSLSRAKVDLAQKESDWSRAQSLLKQQIISREIWEGRQSNYQKALQNRNGSEAEVEMASANLLEAEANLAQLGVLKNQLAITRSRHAEVAIQRQRLLLDINDSIVRSPIDGVIDETFVNSGEYVTPGQRLLMVHDPERIWIKANIKETDIRYIKPGAAVKISVDAYPDAQFSGAVTHVAFAATNQFALLPSPNPSGNFTKITQRLKVKIAVDQVDGLLKPGMMVELEIESR